MKEVIAAYAGDTGQHYEYSTDEPTPIMGPFLIRKADAEMLGIEPGEPIIVTFHPAVIDPDCVAGKHASCIGGTCDCGCHNRKTNDPG